MLPWLALWIIAIILFVTDRKQIPTLWACVTAVVGTFGFLSGMIDDTIRPYLNEHFSRYAQIDIWFHYSSILSSLITQIGLPYVYLMYSVHYSNILTKKAIKILQYTTIIPLLLTIYYTPIYPKLCLNYKLLIFWVAPYILFASFLLIYAFWLETNPRVKKNRLFSAVVATVPMLFSVFSIYFLRIYGDMEAWRWNNLMILLQFISFLVFSIKYGVLGVKINFEMRQLDNTRRVVHSGITIINHTLKNEMNKISLFANRIDAFALDNHHEDIREDVQIILQSTDHILDMSNSIYEKSKKISLLETLNTLLEIMNENLLLLKPYFEEKAIKIMVDVKYDVPIFCDRVHIREVFNNVLMNALEAIQNGGCINIVFYEIKKKIVVAIQDNGEGIAKENLSHLFDPFFSTKDRKKNYGLGLTYCYNVMQKLNGSMYFHSVLGVGTTVFLHFPKKRKEATKT